MKTTKTRRNGNWKRLNPLERALFRASPGYAKHRCAIVNAALTHKHFSSGEYAYWWLGERRIGKKIADRGISMSKDMNMLKYCKGKDVLDAAYGGVYEKYIMEIIRKDRKVLGRA